MIANSQTRVFLTLEFTVASATQRRRSVRRLSCEEFETRLCLSTVSFASHVIMESETLGGTGWVSAEDMDGDGDIDVMSTVPWWSAETETWHHRFVWYENTDGNGRFGPLRVTTVDGGDVSTGDVDGDGDLDVLSASFWFDQNTQTTHGRINWYENTDGAGSFNDQHVITTGDYVPSMYVGDMDSDGDIDVMSTVPRWSAETETLHRRFVWYENTDGKGSFGTEQIISTEADEDRHQLYVADVDGDGDVDLVSAPWNGDKITWHENTDGAGSFGPEQIISAEADERRALAVRRGRGWRWGCGCPLVV